jgi:hypothetical protein
MKHDNSKSDPFYLHRLALGPLVQDKQSSSIDETLQEIELVGAEQFLHFIRWHGLAPLWCDMLTAHARNAGMCTTLMEQLHQDKLNAVAMYMLQLHTLEKIHHLFAGAGIPYAVFKGAQVREIVYAEPALRPASDIDILIKGHARDHAIQVLTQAGMQASINPDNYSHECTFMDGNVAVDLHWHILRPGRIAPDISDELLNTPSMINGFYGMNNPATIFALLVHPAYTRYVCNPYATLIRIVDMVRLFRKLDFDWNQVIELLTRAHARTAAWSTLFWLNLLVESEPAKEIMNRLAPPHIKRSYLEFWIRNNLPFKLESRKILMHFGFTLPLHDSINDALTAIKYRIKHKQLSKP